MKKFIVDVREIHIASVQVEAKDEADAKTKAHQQLIDGEEWPIEYSHTLDDDTWMVEEIK